MGGFTGGTVGKNAKEIRAIFSSKKTGVKKGGVSRNQYYKQCSIGSSIEP